ncbi:AI-2E family transporter [Streptomyces sp. NPDC088124]|uniref:AI-2E family transporter n=1 Tax=Streptomyces sp. NPDC088124 TaxID=3154654 RepID=UPI0034225E36
MSRLPEWLGQVGAELTRLGERLDQRRAEAEAEPGIDAGTGNGSGTTADARAAADARAVAGSVRDDAPPPPAHAPSAAPAPVTAAAPEPVPAPPPVPVVPPVERHPATAIPWGMRVAGEAAWRLLVLGGLLWALMHVISALQLVVMAFVVALLITALLQPTVAWLRRYGMPRGLATALTAISGFVLMGLVGWFVVWQVMENIDDLSNRVTDGINELKRWLLDSPFHVTEDQINGIAKTLSDAVGSNTEAITSVGLQGVAVIVELLTGVFLAVFSTLFLLYDGRTIWNWSLKLVPAAAREGVAGAGPRAWNTLTAYVRGTVLVALIDAIFIGLGIYFLNVPLAVPLAVIIFLGAFIPLVGAVISGALAVVVALVTQDVFTALMVLLVVLGVQQIEGHVLQPFILGRAVRVHALAVVLAVAVGGLVAGIGGAVVAVPLVAVTNTVVGYLRAYSQEQELRNTPPPHGATAYGIAPTPAPAGAVAGTAAGAPEPSGEPSRPARSTPPPPSASPAVAEGGDGQG